MRILAVEQSTHCSLDVILCLKKKGGKKERKKGVSLSLLEWHWHDQLWSGHVLSTDPLLLAKIGASRGYYFKSLTSFVLSWVVQSHYKALHFCSVTSQVQFHTYFYGDDYNMLDCFPMKIKEWGRQKNLLFFFCWFVFFNSMISNNSVDGMKLKLMTKYFLLNILGSKNNGLRI